MKDKKRMSILPILSFIIALIALLFGNNLCERLTGHPLIQTTGEPQTLFLSPIAGTTALSTSTPQQPVDSPTTSIAGTTALSTSTPQQPVDSPTTSAIESPMSISLTLTQKTENLSFCNDASSVVCVFAFGNMENSQGLVTLILSGENPSQIYIMVGRDIYQCNTIEQFPNRLYCTGPELPEGKQITISVFSSESTMPLAEGNFIFPVSTPTKTSTSAPPPTKTSTSAPPPTKTSTSAPSPTVYP